MSIKQTAEYLFRRKYKTAKDAEKDRKSGQRVCLDENGEFYLSDYVE